jgi:isocitrate/isopropylmalate dehydrogenase
MTRTVSEVLDDINACIVGLMHDLKTISHDHDMEEIRIELRFLLDEYRNLYHAWDLSVLNHRTKEMFVD